MIIKTLATTIAAEVAIEADATNRITHAWSSPRSRPASVITTSPPAGSPHERERYFNSSYASATALALRSFIRVRPSSRCRACPLEGGVAGNRHERRDGAVARIPLVDVAARGGGDVEIGDEAPELGRLVVLVP